MYIMIVKLGEIVYFIILLKEEARKDAEKQHMVN